ncbi:NADP-dependent oxidoreductase [Kribbella sp. NBC_01245]|uniref:NADP-dependent oxidoreductase n=1 Tax=Kribbella sp. NBC_01245 TaxID=2903578 RepID=UPI002E2C94F5|nr:NADP-dependent oxidoreductase [Kribbella sp. NBC_01245]
MKAVRYHQYGDSDVLRYEEVDRPTPGAGQVLVRVAGTAFNPADGAIRAGYLQDPFPLRFPHTPGYDMAGTVAETGPGVEGFRIGEPVVGFLPMNEHGAAAEFVLAPAEVLTAAPSGVDLADAAAIPSAALTAWQALFEHAKLQPGQRILINGAGGSVGGLAVQLAAQAGAVVIATASPRSIDKVRSYGADEVIDYTTTSVQDGQKPVDVILNLAPLDTAQQAALLDHVRPGGVLVTTVPPGPEDARAITMFVRNDVEQLATLVKKVDAGELRINVSERYPLADLAQVHELSDAGKLPGKVVLTPGS